MREVAIGGVLRYERIVMAQSAKGAEEPPRSWDHDGRTRLKVGPCLISVRRVFLTPSQRLRSLTTTLAHNVCRVLFFILRYLTGNNRPPKGSTRKKLSAAPSTEGTATPQIPVRAV